MSSSGLASMASHADGVRGRACAPMELHRPSATTTCACTQAHAPPQRRVPRPRRRLRREQAGHGPAGAGLVRGDLGRRVDGIPVIRARRIQIFGDTSGRRAGRSSSMRGAGLPDDGPGLRFFGGCGGAAAPRRGRPARSLYWPRRCCCAGLRTSATSWVRARRARVPSRERGASAWRGAGAAGLTQTCSCAAFDLSRVRAPRSSSREFGAARSENGSSGDAKPKLTAIRKMIHKLRRLRRPLAHNAALRCARIVTDLPAYHRRRGHKQICKSTAAATHNNQTKIQGGRRGGRRGCHPVHARCAMTPSTWSRRRIG